MRIGNFIDLETTGLKPEKGHRIIEIAMILADLDSGREIGRFVRRINPGRSIDPKAQAVHGISLEDLQNEPLWEELAPQVHRIISKSHTLVAHNMDFDGNFIACEMQRVGLELPNVKTLCTMEHSHWATPVGKLPSLYELCFALGVEYDQAQAHGAAYDTEVMMACYFQGRKLGYFPLEEAA